MFSASRLRVSAVALAFLATASCQVDGPAIGVSSTRSGFKDNYMVARTALENGQFGKAERSFASLLRKAGPLEPRIRLEYAHALLRAGKYKKASDEARVVASELTGRGRSAALAVQATADQEIVREAINDGAINSDTIQRLVAARDGFDEMLSKHPDLDPLGSMALRRRTLEVEMSTIN